MPSLDSVKREKLENDIKHLFFELQEKLEGLKNDVGVESDVDKKREKEAEYKKLLSELNSVEGDINNMKSRNEEELLALKDKLEEFRAYKQEILDVLNITPTTYELLKNSNTCKRLLTIVSSDKFKDLKDENGNKLETPEAKLEYIFRKIRTNIVLFMKNKLGESPRTEYVINNTIAPAFERNLMEMLRDQGNETNVSMLQGMNGISLNSLNKFVSGVSKFAQKAAGSYNKFSQWINALDYLSVHNGVLYNPNKSEILTNPLKFQEYLNDSRFAQNGFSPYETFTDNIFKVDENQNFEFGISSQERQEVLNQIGDIQVVNNPNTTSLIVKMLGKSDTFLETVPGLQKMANGLLDGANSLNSITKVFGVDIIGEITKAPEKRSFLFKILDFVCKLIGITGGLEGTVKKWRLDRMDLTDQKSENISQIFKKYKELAGDNMSLSITDENSCKTALNDFAVTDPKNQSTTKGDFLRDSIVSNVDISLISPAVVQQTLGNSYLKKEEVEVKGKKQEKVVVDTSKIMYDEKLLLAHKHIQNMKAHLEQYNINDLVDFYKQINSTEDLALCITASLYADKDDVIEGVKAKVFLPENYGSVRSDGTVSGKENLDTTESSEKSVVSEQWMYEKILEYGITDKRQIAYVLATVKGETNPKGIGFRNVEENGKGNSKKYGKIDSETGKIYYGRGFVQLTRKENYKQYTKIIRDRGKDFKDNEGNTIKCSDIDLEKDPDIILKSNDLAAFILVYGMKNGIFTGKKLDDFINETKTDYVAARSIVNGSDRANQFAEYAQAYLNKLG